MAISSIPCPYKALGLASDASQAAIRSAYKKLMLQCHPDKVHDESQAEEKAAQYEKVREAYELLSDPKRKRKYDIEMQREAQRGKEPSSRSPSAHTEVPESRESSAEGKPREKPRDRTPRRDESRSKKEPEREEFVKPRDCSPEERLPKEHGEREPSNSRASKESREQEPVAEVEEPEDEPPKKEPSHSHSHSRGSSKEKNWAKPESSPPPPSSSVGADIKDDVPEHIRKYEEEKRKEEALLRAARNKMMGIPDEPPSTAPLGGHRQRDESEGRSADREARDKRSRQRREREREAAAAASTAADMDRAKYWEAYKVENEKMSYARQKMAAMNVHDEEESLHPMDDIPQPSPKLSESRRGSAQQRDSSPKDSPPTSRERKSSHSGSERKESVSPVRDSTYGTQKPIPIRNPYGTSAPPPAASSTFSSSFSSSTSPRRRHSVSNSADPTKARLYREDSGYSSPSYPSTPMGPTEPGMQPTFHRSATEGIGERGNLKAFVVYAKDEDEAAAKIMAQAAPSRRRPASNHPLADDNPTAPLRSSKDYRKAPIPSPSAVPASPYYYPHGYYPATGVPTMGYVPAPSSSHPHAHPSRSHSTRHNSHSSHHSSSPHSSPKMPMDGFGGMRSPSISGASTVHPAGYYEYDQAAYFAPPLKNNTF